MAPRKKLIAPPVASPTREQVHRTALLASVTGQTFEDVKFFAFSRRTRTGGADSPLPLVANSTLIRKASSHFDLVFATGFAESGVTNMNAPYPSMRIPSIDSYDYESDSDLEDEEEEGPTDRRSASLNGVGVDDSEKTTDTEGTSSETDDKAAKSKEDTERVLREEKGVLVAAKLGRVVFLEDIAYATWKAFIFYAYFDEVEFAPLRSQHTTRPENQAPYKAPMCSPKSLYRVAHKYDIAALKEKTMADIKSKLTTHNIFEEIFSKFTSLYPEIQAIELEYLRSNIKDSGVQARFPTWLEAMENGNLPKGAASIIASLISKLNFEDNISKRCPYGCTAGNYRCNNCGSNF